MTGSLHAIRWQIICEVFGNLLDFKMRVLLALTGITIGTASVITMLHIGYNARAEALRQFERLGIDLVTIMPPFSNGRTSELSNEKVKLLSRNDIGIDQAASLIQFNLTLGTKKAPISATMIAATDEIYDIGKIETESGRQTAEIDGFSPFAMLGSDIAEQLEQLKGKPISIGETMVADGHILTIVGILKRTWPNIVLGIDFNRSILIPFGASKRFMKNPKITGVAARISPAAVEAETVNRIITHFADETGADSPVDVRTARQMIAGLQEQMRIYSLLLLAIGSVSLVVGGVGIMNVMLMNVMERRQEIGLRIAIGAKQRDIRTMFLAEAILLSLMGSLAGTALGYIGGWLFCMMSAWPFSPASTALPLGVGLAIAVGLFFGSYPAARAARLDPISALKAE